MNIDPSILTALATLIAAIASLIWSIRRRPDRD